MLRIFVVEDCYEHVSQIGIFYRLFKNEKREWKRVDCLLISPAYLVHRPIRIHWHPLLVQP
jgi:hypothetical protein